MSSRPPKDSSNSNNSSVASKVAVAIASTVVVVITTYSYLHWRDHKVKEPTSPQHVEIKNSKTLIQEDNRESDSESEELSESPPSSPAPNDEYHLSLPSIHEPKIPSEKTTDSNLSLPQTERDEEEDVNSQSLPPTTSLVRATESNDTSISPEDIDDEEPSPRIYREDAIRIFKGFAKGKRSKKGVSLKTACVIFDEAWSINKNPRDMVLPGQVISHFKRTLPSKNERK